MRIWKRRQSIRVETSLRARGREKKSPQQDSRSPLPVNGSGQIIQSSSNPNLLQVAAVRAHSTLWPTELSETRAFTPKKKTIIRDQCALTASLVKRAGLCVWEGKESRRVCWGSITKANILFRKERKRNGSTRMRSAHLTRAGREFCPFLCPESLQN